jgi:hypothetical protein
MLESEITYNDTLNNDLMRDYKKNNDLPLSVVSVMACSFLVYIMGRFYLAELFNVKRLLEIILLIPIISYVLIFFINGKFRLKFNPLIFFALQLFFNSIYFSMDYLKVSDLFFSLLALIVIASAPIRSVYVGAKWIISIATFFSISAYRFSPFCSFNLCLCSFCSVISQK